MQDIIEKGSITLSTENLLRYKTDCESFMEDIGSVAIEDITIPSDNGYFLVFYSPEDEKYILKEEHNCFFNIYDDKNLNFGFYTKSSGSSIPKDMRYVIIKV